MEKNRPANAGDVDSIPRLVRLPEKEMTTHSSILVWEIPWTEGCKRARHDLAAEQQANEDH